MKKAIDNSGGMITWVEVRPMTNPAHQGWQHVRIATSYEESQRDPTFEQVKFEMCMDPKTFANFRACFNEM